MSRKIQEQKLTDEQLQNFGGTGKKRLQWVKGNADFNMQAAAPSETLTLFYHIMFCRISDDRNHTGMMFPNKQEISLQSVPIYGRLYQSGKGKGLPQEVEVAQGVPDGLRPRIFLTFGTTRVVGCQPQAPSALTPGEIPGTHFQRLSRPQGTCFRRQLREKSRVTYSIGNRSRDRPTSSVVP